jgi:HD-GYP domain-containing protein (c-di-GMP phosphodiesterase class II)
MLSYQTESIIPFTKEDEEVLEASSFSGQLLLSVIVFLILRLENLFREFTGLINGAIDDKSPYTGAHCRRVPVLTRYDRRRS